MIVEKGLKAIIADKTNDMPPKIHSLKKLAVLGWIYDYLTEEQLLLFKKLTPLQIEARYSEYNEEILNTFTSACYIQLLDETEEFLYWIGVTQKPTLFNLLLTLNAYFSKLLSHCCSRICNFA